MTIECFILLSIMADSKYGLSEKDRDIQRFLEKTSGDSKFKDMLKLIMEGNSTKKVDNFLDNQELLAQNFNNPAGLPQDLYEATMRQYGRKEFGDYTTDDMKLIIDAQKNKGLV